MKKEFIFGREYIKFWEHGGYLNLNTIDTYRRYVSLGSEGAERASVFLKETVTINNIKDAVSSAFNDKVICTEQIINPDPDASITHAIRKENSSLDFYRKHLFLFSIQNKEHAEEFLKAFDKALEDLE